MTLTLSDGPLNAKQAPPSNYEIEGPKHRILWDIFPRRIRAELGGETALDSEAGRLLHESQIRPVLYVPKDDVRAELLEPTETSTHCPFKGDASYFSIRAGDQLATDAVWYYPEPNPEASWLADHYAFYWAKLDAWYDEDERVFNHPRDPYHRVDARRSSRPWRASIDGTTVASSDAPWILSETGFANRVYFPAEDVERSLLQRADKSSHCPYKGDATWWSFGGGEGEGRDEIAWSYEEPFDDATRIGGAISFDGDGVEVERA